ncbi:hypothetical protein ABZ446_42305 [Streptomyces sp. NPDC005813]|uniref:hypothetical protein n=1 Tax=Streptomyces sp. NPDC005813 TaxID=3155592 RepID=UPI0033E280C6
MTNTIGEERRLGRNGAYGVAKLVRLVAPKAGEPLGVEVRDGGDEARVLLPWRYWFGGIQGDERWAGLIAALGVPVVDEEVRHGEGSTRGSGDTQPWWKGHLLANDVLRMSPMDAKEARDSTNWKTAVIGSNESLIISIFSLPLLPGILSDRGPALLAGVLSALTIVGELGPVVVDALISRCWYDRPHSTAADTSTTSEPS